ncbi:UV DNA damage repair endonuclease UvsE [Desertibacillus haloalkaliphilus]|uniref:UV DNA damage repair endonuclease UvsE n=1 Tax=Desertibacillus haloalkaliphilus TaxID=1328930 RepID=UPI001C26C37F|nr:UV DNA damage repair endonuclease UvsE [Desertibacillus haloalkaliphilus]MBU8907139.1 UV DNA damage repair endonuclease UvsE [Desertibacillus haloalkaliphilus]
MYVRFGYVAMSELLQNASPSQTMTATQFEKIVDREARLRRLERISNANLDNCLRLVKHNAAHDISFFRLSSRLIPLVNHPLTEGWKYEKAIFPNLKQLGEYIRSKQMRVDFHPDHFVVLNNPDEEVFNRSLQTLLYHYKLLKGLGVDPTHRCVLHIGGKKHGKVSGLETFIDNFENIPSQLQKMIMIENDDTVYHTEDALYLGEKLGIPVVFDLHHHDVNHPETPLSELWPRVVATWSNSPLPVKMHISSPIDGELDKRHHDYIDKDRLLHFLETINGTCEELDIMIEAKKKDVALFTLMEQLSAEPSCELTSEASIHYMP